jgi:integrase
MSPKGSGCTYQPKGCEVWWIKFYHDGQQYRESSKSRIRADAVKLLRDRMGSSDKGTLVAAAGKVTVQHIVDAYVARAESDRKRSFKRIKRAARQVIERLGGHLARDLKLRHIEAELVDVRRGEGWADATIAYNVAILRAAYRAAHRRELVAVVPAFPTFQLDNARQTFVEYADFDKIRAKLPETLARMMTFALYTGWRTHSELRPLTWARVDTKGGTIRLHTSKSHQPRVYVYRTNPELADAIGRQQLAADAYALTHDGRRPEYVFFSERGRMLSSKRFYTEWQKACKAAKLPDTIPHDLRRSCVRNLENAGVSRDVAKKMVGHETDAMYQRYHIVNETDLANGSAALARA